MTFDFFEDHPELKWQAEKRKKIVEEARNHTTHDFIARAIHNLHNCGDPICSFKEEQTEQGSRYTQPVYWKDSDPVYDAQQRYTMAPEGIVRLWCLLPAGHGHNLRYRQDFPTKCPICQADVRHIFSEFTK